MLSLNCGAISRVNRSCGYHNTPGHNHHIFHTTEEEEEKLTTEAFLSEETYSKMLRFVWL